MLGTEPEDDRLGESCGGMQTLDALQASMSQRLQALVTTWSIACMAMAALTRKQAYTGCMQDAGKPAQSSAVWHAATVSLVSCEGQAVSQLRCERGAMKESPLARCFAAWGICKASMICHAALRIH